MGDFSFSTTPPTLPGIIPPPVAQKPFSFGASGAPTLTPQAGAGAGSPAAPGGFDMNALLQLMQKQMQGQQQQQTDRSGLARDVMFGRHLGIGGAPMTPGNPTGNPGDPFGAGGLFTTPGPIAKAIGPEAVARSQGANAVNQWKQPNMFGGQAFQGALPTSAQGQVLDSGMGPMSPRGMQTQQGVNGPAQVYDPRFDSAGRSGIESQYDPAIARKPNPRSRIQSMFGRM